MIYLLYYFNHFDNILSTMTVPTSDIIEVELCEGSFDADDETSNCLEDLEAAGL